MTPILLLAVGFASFAVSDMAADAALGAAKNWPQWRGPNAQGVSEAKGLPEKWSATQHMKWKVDLPGVGHGSPCVWSDRVFITASIPEGDEIKPGNPAHPKPTGPIAKFRFMRYQFQILCFNRLTGERQVAVNATKRIRSYDYNTGAVIWECGGMTKGVIPTIVSGYGMAFAASSAGGGFLGENGTMVILKAGPAFEVLGMND